MNIGFTQLIPRVGVPLQLQQPVPTRIRTYNPFTGIPGPSFSNFHSDNLNTNEDAYITMEHRGAETGVVTTITGKKSEVIKIRRVLEIWENSRARQNTQNRVVPDTNTQNRVVPDTNVLLQLDSDEPLMTAVVATAGQQTGGYNNFELIPRF